MTNVIRVDLPFSGATADGDDNVNRVWRCMQEIDARTQVSLHSFFPFFCRNLMNVNGHLEGVRSVKSYFGSKRSAHRPGWYFIK